MLSKRLLSSSASSPPIEYVGGRTYSWTGTLSAQTISLTTLSGGVASSPSAADLVVVLYGIGSSSDRTPSATGYTLVADLFSSDTECTNLYLGYKIMGSTPDTSITLSGLNATNNYAVVAIHVWRNVSTTSPLDVSAVTATGTNSVYPNPPAITPVTPGAVILACGAGGVSTGISGTFSSSQLSNFVTVNTTLIIVGIGSYNWTSGSFDPNQFSFSGSTNTAFSWAAVTIALRPK